MENKLLMYITIIFIVPISEELIFRGAIFGGLRHKFGFWGASTISSVVFGIIHGTVMYAIGMFIVGTFLCLAYEKTRNILTNIIVHIINNAISFVPLSNLLNETMPGKESITIDIVITCTSAIIGIVMFIILFKGMNAERKMLGKGNGNE